MKTMISLRLDPELLALADVEAARAGLTRTALIERLLIRLTCHPTVTGQSSEPRKLTNKDLCRRA
jgi:hypothetical protein